MIPVTSPFLLVSFSTEGISVCHPLMTVVSQTSQADIYLSPICNKPLTVAQYLEISTGQYRLDSVKIQTKHQIPSTTVYFLLRHSVAAVWLTSSNVYSYSNCNIWPPSLQWKEERLLRVKKNNLRSRPESAHIISVTGQNSLVSPQRNC